MILQRVINGFFNIVIWILMVCDFPESSPMLTILTGMDSLITYVFTNVGSIFFFFVPQATFFSIMDILFFLWVFKPLYLFVMWLLRKIPFLNMS